MPRTSLFKVELHIVDEYLKKIYEKDDSDYIDIDPYEIIKPGMIFTMNYTHTKNYKSEETSISVIVESVPFAVECCNSICIKAILKTEKPIYICERNAMLGRSISIHDEITTIATGGVEQILDTY